MNSWPTLSSATGQCDKAYYIIQPAADEKIHNIVSYVFILLIYFYVSLTFKRAFGVDDLSQKQRPEGSARWCVGRTWIDGRDMTTCNGPGTRIVPGHGCEGLFYFTPRPRVCVLTIRHIPHYYPVRPPPGTSFPAPPGTGPKGFYRMTLLWRDNDDDTTAIPVRTRSWTPTPSPHRTRFPSSLMLQSSLVR